MVPCLVYPHAVLLDLRYAWRGIRKARGFTAVILLTLALGIGANTTIFSIVHAMLIEPLPYRDADRLAFIWLGYSRGPLSGPDFRDIREGTSSFSELGGIWASGTVALSGDGRSRGAAYVVRHDEFLSAPRRRKRVRPNIPAKTMAAPARRRPSCSDGIFSPADTAAIRRSSAGRFSSTTNRRRSSA